MSRLRGLLLQTDGRERISSPPAPLIVVLGIAVLTSCVENTMHMKGGREAARVLRLFTVQMASVSEGKVRAVFCSALPVSGKPPDGCIRIVPFLLLIQYKTILKYLFLSAWWSSGFVCVRNALIPAFFFKIYFAGQRSSSFSFEIEILATADFHGDSNYIFLIIIIITSLLNPSSAWWTALSLRFPNAEIHMNYFFPLPV